MSIFEAVKQSVTTRQAAERYGIRVERNGMCRCPFHEDRTPSMKLDRRYYCFGCGATGDAIDFVSRLRGIGSKEAATLLAQDFAIPYEDGTGKMSKPRQQNTDEQNYQHMERYCFRVLLDYYRLLCRWKEDYAPQTPEDGYHPHFVEALQKLSLIAYLLDELLGGDMQARASVVIEYGEEVRKLEQRMAELAAADEAATQIQAGSIAPPMSIEEVKAMLDTTEKGGVRNSIKNCLTVFQHDPLLSGAIAYNLLTDRTDIVKPIGYDRSPSSSMTDTDMKYIRLYLEENYDLTSEKKIIDAADLAAHQNSYHPVRDYLNSLAWDGTERIRYCLHHFLGAEADEYTFQALRLFLLGAIHRAFHPGCKFEVMLCLVGGQGAGKSTFFRLLAGKDEWFSDDLRKLDDENVYRKLQGHWIIEMSEMIATANAKSIEEIKSFLSRQKEVYKIPYETHPADRLRQCVFGGTSNAMDFLPLDRSGNRRFLPVQVCPEQAEVHILEDEAASRSYLQQVWAEAMTIYRAGGWKLTFSPEMVRYLKEHQKDFMPEDTKAGMIQAFLDSYTGDTVCSKQLYKEALNHAFDEPKQWEIREINEIMNQCVTGWTYFSNPRSFAGYGRQKGWEREKTAMGSGNQNTEIPDGFVEITEQMELPF